MEDVSLFVIEGVVEIIIDVHLAGEGLNHDVAQDLERKEVMLGLLLRDINTFRGSNIKKLVKKEMRTAVNQVSMNSLPKVIP